MTGRQLVWGRVTHKAAVGLSVVCRREWWLLLVVFHVLGASDIQSLSIFMAVPWSRSNKSILKETNPEYSLAGQMLKLKLQYFGHVMQRANSLEKTLMLGKTEGQEVKGIKEKEMIGGWHHWFNGPEFEQNSRRWWRTGEAWNAAVHGIAKSQIGPETQQQYLEQGITPILYACVMSCHVMHVCISHLVMSDSLWSHGL